MFTRSLKFIRRNLNGSPGNTATSTAPVSKVFGSDRGTPIDRYYIERFLSANQHLIKGKVLEIAESKYSKRFGSNVTSFEVLHFAEGNANATLVADLTDSGTLPENFVNCFICTQTIHMIYDFKAAIAGAFKLLGSGGVMLATVPGITQISRYDMDRWGDYWRFTTLSALMSFEEVFGKGNVSVSYFGNCLSATSFLRGFALEEMNKTDLDVNDPDYPVIITIVAKKNNN
jgi:hypothetical protein